MRSLLDRRKPTDLTTGIYRHLFDSESVGQIAITENELFDVLADSRRRAVIERVADLDGSESMNVDELAREIAEEETHMPEAHLPAARIEQVAAELTRTHLPMLEAAQIVRWRGSEREISPGNSIQPIAEWLRAMHRHLEPVPDHKRVHQAEANYPSWR